MSQANQAEPLKVIEGKRKFRSEPPAMPAVRQEMEYWFRSGASCAYIGSKRGLRVVAVEAVIRERMRRQDARIMELEARHIERCMGKAA